MPISRVPRGPRNSSRPRAPLDRAGSREPLGTSDAHGTKTSEQSRHQTSPRKDRRANTLNRRTIPRSHQKLKLPHGARTLHQSKRAQRNQATKNAKANPRTKSIIRRTVKKPQAPDKQYGIPSTTQSVLRRK